MSVPHLCLSGARAVLHSTIALLLTLLVGTASAHMQAVPIELWGSFLPGSVTCLRTMSGATHTCFDAVLAAEQACHDALARGESCDRGAVDATVDAAAQAMRVAATGACAEGQLTEIGYFGFFDANADLTNACVTQAREAIAAVYAPAGAAACVSAAAAYSRKVMWYILQRTAPVMERIATRVFAPAEKTAAVLRLERDLSSTRERWIAGLLDLCPQFADVYGVTAESFLRMLKQRTDCVLSKTYINSLVSCAAPPPATAR